jgi:Uma2 family endonuclease
MSTIAHRPHSWTRAEYDRLVDAGGFLPGIRVELIDGEIFDLAPQKSQHSTAVRLIEDALRAAFGAGFDVRCQLPFALDSSSEPEPDLAVVEGSPRDYRDAHPSEAVLIVEVADSSLEFDRTRKLAAYARNDIPEYWILNLESSVLEVCRRPRAQDYGDRRTYESGDGVTPLHAPQQRLLVADLLP